MSREIKFRAYYGKPGESEMYYNVGFHPTMIFRLSDCDVDDSYNDQTGDLIVSPITYNVMQFTGLQDKNGKDIYEGDILITKYQDKEKMIWHNEFACFCYETIDPIVKGDYQFTFKDVEIEIIGNIYEHPNLLTHV